MFAVLDDFEDAREAAGAEAVAAAAGAVAGAEVGAAAGALAVFAELAEALSAANQVWMP
jgi:hypothetical protein